METPSHIFESVCQHMKASHPGVERGKMMSSPALQYESKVFAFFYKESMVFKLGRDTVPEDQYNIDDYELLSPFKTKPPLKDWFVIPTDYAHQWVKLAEHSYKKMVGY